MSTFASSIPVAAMLLVSAVIIGAPAAAADQEAEQAGRKPNEAREITYKEARDLLTAFLRVPPGAVMDSGDMGYKAFYFFMADMGSSCGPDGVCVGNFQYYAVDRRTGDVWSSVICQRIAAPALTRLQATLRKRIGLTNTECERLRRSGPLCEPGLPRASSGK
jgi:hypothetical protein